MHTRIISTRISTSNTIFEWRKPTVLKVLTKSSALKLGSNMLAHILCQAPYEEDVGMAHALQNDCSHWLPRHR